MGAWGAKLNQNDLYADVRDFYTALLRCGMSEEEALIHTLHEFAAYENDSEERELFWFSLADIMWKLGRLTDDIKCKTLTLIDSHDELKKWYEISKILGDSRKEVIVNLKKRLESDQPPKKKFRKKDIKNAVGEMATFLGTDSLGTFQIIMTWEICIFLFRKLMTFFIRITICPSLSQ